MTEWLLHSFRYFSFFSFPGDLPQEVNPLNRSEKSLITAHPIGVTGAVFFDRTLCPVDPELWLGSFAF
jgi:hypothetical protein